MRAERQRTSCVRFAEIQVCYRTSDFASNKPSGTDEWPRRNRSGRGAHPDLAAGAFFVPALHGGLPGPHQSWFCRIADAAATRIQRRRLWLRRGGLLRRIFLLSGTEQSGARARWSSAMDCGPHGDMGNHFCGDESGREQAEFLCVAFSARGGRGGLFSGCNSLSEKLVSGQGACADGGEVYDGGALVGSHRRTAVRRAARFTSRGRAGWVAMDVPVGRYSRDRAGRDGVGIFGGSSGIGTMVERRATGVVAANHATRGSRDDGCVQVWRLGGSSAWENLDPGARLFWVEHCLVWHEPLAAEPDQ